MTAGMAGMRWTGLCSGALAFVGGRWQARRGVRGWALFAALALTSTVACGGDAEPVQATLTTLSGTAPGGAAVAESTPTSILRSEQIRIKGEVRKSFLNYDAFEVAPVKSDDPATMVQELNKLLAVALMDSDVTKADLAAWTLTGPSRTPDNFRKFIETTRARNLNELSPTTASRRTFSSDPNDIEVVRSGPNYEIIRTTNVLLSVSDRKTQEPQEIAGTESPAYYYVRVLPDSTKQLLGVYAELSEWQGEASF